MDFLGFEDLGDEIDQHHDGELEPEPPENDFGELPSGDAEETQNEEPEERRSKQWKHFDLIVVDGQKFAKCKHCPKKYLMSGKSNGSTGNLDRHMIKKHPEKLVVGPGDQDEAFTFSQENFRKALLRWIIECNQPFTEPQQNAFVALVLTLNPNATVVSDKTIKADLMAEFANKIKELKTEIAGVPGKISITMDAWTSKNSLAFLAIRAHWLDREWNYHSKLLDFAHIEGEHTGFNLSQIFVDCLVRLEIPFKKIMAVTLDNATNNDTFFTYLEQHGITAVNNRMRCMAHIINLSVQDIMATLKVPYVADLHDYDENEDELENEVLADIDLNEEIDEVDDIELSEDVDLGTNSSNMQLIVKLRTLVKKIRKSVQMRQKLKKICEAYGLKYLVPVIDVPTRWNSSNHMICRAEQLKVPLRNLCSNEKTLISRQITDQEWLELNEIKNLLSKFERATKIMSMERHATNSAYLPTLDWLIATLTEYIEENSGPLAEAARYGLIKLKKYELDITKSKLPFICTFLHPALKMSYFKEHDYGRGTIRAIQAEIMDYFVQNYEPPAPPSSRKCRRDNDESVSLGDDDEFRKHMFKRSKVANESTEFMKYANWPLSHNGVDTVEFWKSNQKDFPCLSLMARDFLPIQSGSVSVERDFSKGVHVVTPTRASLQENTISAVMCVKSWYCDTKNNIAT